MARLVTIRFEDAEDAAYFVRKHGEGWSTAVANGNAAGQADPGVPREAFVALGPTGIERVEDAPDDRDLPYWAEKEAMLEERARDAERQGVENTSVYPY